MCVMKFNRYAWCNICYMKLKENYESFSSLTDGCEKCKYCMEESDEDSEAAIC
jgi:hypothetical protein